MTDRQILDRLARLRGRIRWMLVVDGLACVAIAVVVGVFVATVIDYLMWLPAGVRLCLGVALVGTVAVLAWRRVVSPAVRRIALSEVASVLDARFAELQDRLASSVGLMHDSGGASEAMIRQVVDETTEVGAKLPFDAVLRWRRPAITLTVGLVLCGALTGSALATPWFLSTGLRRYVDPFGPARWPRRVHIEPLAGDAIRPMGGWFEARARVVRGESDGLRVYLHTLAPSGRHQRYGMTFDAKAAEYFHTVKDLRSDLTYWFEAGDDTTADRGGVFSLRVLPRPAVAQAELMLDPPAYIGASSPTPIVLGDAPVSAIAGSRARLTVRTNKTIEPDADGSARAWIVLPTGAETDLEPSDDAGRSFTAAFPVIRSGSMAVKLVDEHGFDNHGGTPFAMNVRQDEPPQVVVVQPQAVLEVTPAATVELAISAEDDFGIDTVGFEIVGEPPLEVDLTGEARMKTSAGRATASVEHAWSLVPLDLKPGQLVTYRAVARDTFELDGRRHDPGTSPEMRLKVISPETLLERVRDDLLMLKGALRQMLSSQQALQDETDTVRDDVTPEQGLADGQRETVRGLSSNQARLASRAKYLSRRFDAVQDRLRANRSTDPEIGPQVRQASKRLAALSAGSMREASEDLQQSATAAKPTEQADRLDSARGEQQRAVDELRSLLATMDRWGDFQDIVRHAQQLLDQQERQTEKTQQLAKETLGKRVENLSDRLANELKGRTREQRRLASNLDRLTANMERLAKALEVSDSTVAATLREAVARARDGGLTATMRRASEAVSENRMAEAGEAQREAEERLRELLQQLEGRRSEELATLSKKLAGAEAKVQALLDDQKRLRDETQAMDAEDPQARDRLARRQRGLERAAEGIASEVGKMNQASRSARGLRRSSGQMGQAAGSLAQGDKGEAGQQQDEAIQELERALEVLKKLRKQAEAKMAAKSLAAILDELKTVRSRQGEINEQLDPMTKRRDEGEALTRLDLRRLSKMSDQERSVAEKVSALRQRLEASPVYEWVVRRVGKEMTKLAGRFDQRRADAETDRLARTILNRLDQLITGLSLERPDQKKEDEPFAGGGQGGGKPTKQKPVPTVAELMVVKSLQEDLNQRTRRAELKREMRSEPTEEDLEAVRQLGQEQEEIRNLTLKLMEGAR